MTEKIANNEALANINTNKQPMINNEELDKAITNFYTSRTDINRQMFLEKLLTAEILAPINIANATVNEENQVVIPKKSDITLMMLQNEQGDNYCPVFTNDKELNKFNQERSGVLKQNFVKLANSLVKNIKDNDGIVVNPFGESITLNKPVIEAMLKAADKTQLPRNYTISSGTKVLIGEPKNYPQKMVEIMVDVLKNHHCVQNAWLRLMERPDHGLSYLVIIESVDEDITHMFTDIAKLCKPYTGKIPQDFIKYNKDSAFIMNAIKGAKPFYKKHKKLFGLF